MGKGEPRYTLKEAQEKLKMLPRNEVVVSEQGSRAGLKLLITKTEPRFSVAELEKIFDYNNPEYFIRNLKDSKKVEKILNG